MRITFLSPVSLRYFGGAEKWIVNTSNLLASMGWEVEIVTLPYEYKGENIAFNELKKVFDNGIIYREVKSGKIESDITYVYYQPFFWRLFKIKSKMIAGLHTPGIFFGPTIRRFVFRLFKRVELKQFDCVHILNEALLKEVPHDNRIYIPNWMDTKKFRPREKYDEFTIAFVGRRTKDKGWNTFVDVCRAIEKRGLPIRCIATGNGKCPKPIKSLGFLSEDELAKIMAETHLVVYPSTKDIFSLTITEAMSCGTPVVTTPVLSHLEMDLPMVVTDSINGYLHQIASIFEKWSRNNGEYEKMCEDCRNAVMEKYDVRVVFPKFENTCKIIANGGSSETTNSYSYRRI